MAGELPVHFFMNVLKDYIIMKKFNYRFDFQLCCLRYLRNDTDV